MTKIEWAKNADGTPGKSWNPVTGCSKISPGCRNCYACQQWPRFRHSLYGGREFTDVAFHPGRLDAPLRRRIPTTYFVNSMSDLFHEAVSDSDILAVLNVIRQCDHHRFLILTKRAERLLAFMPLLCFDASGAGRMYLEDRGLNRQGAPISFAPVMHQMWIGVSVENKPTAEERIPLLLDTPAALRFVSYEPALEGVDFSPYLNPPCTHEDASVEPDTNALVCRECDEEPATQLDLIIVGGESGSKARPFDVGWARSVVKQCRWGGAAAFVKQLGAAPYLDPPMSWPGEFMVDDGGRAWPALRHPKGGDPDEWPEDLKIREMPR